MQISLVCRGEGGNSENEEEQSAHAKVSDTLFAVPPTYLICAALLAKNSAHSVECIGMLKTGTHIPRPAGNLFPTA
jgi:hypothetical protein